MITSHLICVDDQHVTTHVTTFLLQYLHDKNIFEREKNGNRETLEKHVT